MVTSKSGLKLATNLKSRPPVTISSVCHTPQLHRPPAGRAAAADFHHVAPPLVRRPRLRGGHSGTAFLEKRPTKDNGGACQEHQTRRGCYRRPSAGNRASAHAPGGGENSKSLRHHQQHAGRRWALYNAIVSRYITPFWNRLSSRSVVGRLRPPLVYKAPGRLERRTVEERPL